MDDAARSVLGLLLDRLIPADEWPSATEVGVVAHVERVEGAEYGTPARVLGPGLAAVDAESRARFEGRSVGDLDPAEVDELLRAVERNDVSTEWPVGPGEFLSTLVRLAAEGYYAPSDSPGWAMVGYDAGPKRGPGADVVHSRPSTCPFEDVSESYDVVVVGAGAGGGVAACVMAEAGARVLLVDRGQFLLYDEIERDHLRNHRLSIYGHNTGPEVEGNPRVLVGRGGKERLIRSPHLPEWHNTAMTVGGGTRVYQGMAWRFLPDDFRLASIYGVPDGSSLADWPISYDDLEPYYERAEWEVGVAGDGTAHRVQGPRARGYPMPPLPWNPEAEILASGAASLGLSTGPVPVLINSVPRAGRAQCVQCGECVGFPCPSDAKNGTFNTVIPRAVATGRCDLVPSCRALRVSTDGRGRVDAVELLDVATGARRRVRAGNVVVAAGAIETARLLLTSRTDSDPDGLGNTTGQVGRNLQGHLYVGAFGLFDDPVQDMRGPGVRIATCDFHHGDKDVIGGGVIANEVIKLPILHWYWALPPQAARWGIDAKHVMRDLYRRTSHLFGPIQEIPDPEARVTLAENVVDASGVPVARLSGGLHPESLKVAEAQQARSVEWMEASGASTVWTVPFSNALTAGQHQAGTCRMGADPATSVTDPWGRVHGHDNLWVVDASLHVTNGGFNPVLTILALAYRSAGRLAAS